MRDLDLIDKALEAKVKEYLENYNGDDDFFSDDLDFDVTVNGTDFSAIVSVNGYFSLVPYYENDKFGYSYLRGHDCNLDTFDFEIKDLWDSEIGEYIVEDYKNIEK